MNDPAADAHVQAEVRRYDNELHRAGLRTVSCGETPSEWRWRGRIEAAGVKVEIEIALTERFPYGPPDILLSNRAGRPGWHQGAGGALCLWDSHTLGDLPWMDVPGLFDRVRQWIAKDSGGWSDDDPALDLEAYHAPHLVGGNPRRRVPLLVLHDWSDLGKHWFHATMPNEYGRIDLASGRRLGPQPAGPKSKGGKRVRRPRHLDCVGVDLGEIAAPHIDTAGLLEAMGTRRAAAEATLAARRPVLAVCRYSRLGAVGLIGYWITVVNDKVSCGYFEVAETSAAQRRRAGWHAPRIAERTVTVLGAGSVGSYLTDLLHRSGVVGLTVCDADRLKPGNLVRHAAPFRYVGADKTHAVHAITLDRDPGRPIETAGRMQTLGDALGILRDRDLVVDCTGDRLTWHLLLDAARIADRRFLHVAVEGHGQFGRVDVCPPFHGSDPLPASDVQHMTLTQREGGCGDPISPTPPIAAFETAAMGARIAVRMLAGEVVSAAGERRPLFSISS